MSVGRTSSERGVTLLEMIVVVVIIGVIAGVSAPSVSSGIDSVRLVSATSSISSFLNAGVSRADRRQQPIELVISPKENLMALYSNEPGFQRELKMPDGIAIEAVLPKLPEEFEEADSNVRRFVLMPGATAPGVGIQIANRHGARRMIRLDPMTGYPRVEAIVAR